MQADVKTSRIEIEIPDDFEFYEENDDELINVFETEWYKNIKAKMTPGDYLKIYRENHGMTQAELGNLLGGIPRQQVSNMERGIRSISLKMAQKLAQIFDVSVEKFL